MNRLAVSLKTKMAVAVSALVVSLVLAMGVLSISYFRGQFKEAIARQQFALVTALADRIDQELARSRDEIAEIAEGVSPEMLRDPAVARQFLESRGKGELNYDHGLVLIDTRGRLLAEAPVATGREGGDYSSSGFATRVVATGKPCISDPYILSGAHDHPVITFAAPVCDAQGRLQAVLGGHLEQLSDNFLGKLSRLPIGERGYISLYTADLTTIMHPDRRRILEKGGLPGKNQFLERAVAGFEGTEERVNARNIPVLTSVKRLHATNWLLAANYPLAEAYAPIDQATRYFLVALVLLGALSVLFAWFLMKRLSAPLLALTRHMAELPGKEGAEKLFATGTADEIGILAEKFNAMVQELDRQQGELRKSKELYQLVADFSSDMAFWRSPEGGMRYVSPQCQPLTGFAEEEFHRDPQLLDRIIHSEDRERWLDHQHLTGAHLQPVPLEFRIVTKGGEVRWVSHVCRTVHDASGAILGVRGSFSDSTDLKRASEELHNSRAELMERHEEMKHLFHLVEGKKEELEKAYAELKATHSQMLQQEKMASIGQLAAGVAHEINNPVGFIMSNLATLGKYGERLVGFIQAQADALAAPSSPERMAELSELRRRLKLDQIIADLGQLIRESIDGAERVKKIVQDLKSFSRMDEVEWKTADINDCLESTLNIVWNELKYKAVVNREYGGLPLTRCNPGQLNQVFMNLLVNAAHALEREGTITVRSWHGDGSVNVAIADNGCGIPEEIRKKIFDPFFTTKEVGKGTGLGLSISYDIVKKHGGEIRVESEVGKGTTFTVTLPVIEQ